MSGSHNGYSINFDEGILMYTLVKVGFASDTERNVVNAEDENGTLVASIERVKPAESFEALELNIDTEFASAVDLNKLVQRATALIADSTVSVQEFED